MRFLNRELDNMATLSSSGLEILSASEQSGISYDSCYSHTVEDRETASSLISTSTQESRKTARGEYQSDL